MVLFCKTESYCQVIFRLKIDCLDFASLAGSHVCSDLIKYAFTVCDRLSLLGTGIIVLFCTCTQCTGALSRHFFCITVVIDKQKTKRGSLF